MSSSSQGPNYFPLFSNDEQIGNSFSITPSTCDAFYASSIPSSQSDAPRKIMAIMGLGHPLLDIVSNTSEAYLNRFGIKPGSCTLANPKQLSIFEELSQQRDVEFVPGGSSMNTLRVTRWMLRDFDDAFCCWLGSIGDDEFGCILERACTKGGVKTYFQRVDEHPTGCCACMIVNKERSLVAHLGAAVHVTMDHILSEDVLAVIKHCEVFFFEGFFFNTVSSPKNMIYIGKHCLEYNKVFVQSISEPYLCQAFKDYWKLILPYVDILFGNRNDIKALAEALGWQDMELNDQIMKLVNYSMHKTRKVRLLVITGGADPTLVASVNGVTEYEVPSISLDMIVDTNGAGDAFCGGFLSQFLQYKPLEVCVEAAHAAAYEVIQHNGCTFDDTPPIIGGS